MLWIYLDLPMITTPPPLSGLDIIMSLFVASFLSAAKSDKTEENTLTDLKP